MKDFLERIVTSIIVSPNYQIEEENQSGLMVFTILVPEEEMGKIIGKEGKVINAIRCLCRVKAIKNQQKVLVKIDKLQGEVV